MSFSLSYSKTADVQWFGEKEGTINPRKKPAKKASLYWLKLEVWHEERSKSTHQVSRRAKKSCVVECQRLMLLVSQFKIWWYRIYCQTQTEIPQSSFREDYRKEYLFVKYNCYSILCFHIANVWQPNFIQDTLNSNIFLLRWLLAVTKYWYLYRETN